MLIWLFIIPAVLTFTNIPSLKLAGIISGVCLLPGLTLFSFFKKNNLSFDDLVLAFPVSTGLSSLLSLLLLWMNVNINYVSFIVFFLSALFIIASFIRKRNFFVKLEITRDEFQFMVTALICTLILSVPIISQRIAISHHGFHHFSLVNSVLNGFFPPDNPGIGGQPIGYHWGYHALIATLTAPTNINPLRIFSVMNAISLFIIFCIAYQYARIFNISQKLSYIMPFAIIGLMRSDAIFYFIKNIIAGDTSHAFINPSTPLHLLSNWVWGVSYLDTRLFFINKFYNANNMPIGISLLFSFFLIVLMIISGNDDRKTKIYLMISMSLTLIGLAFNYAFFLIIPLTVAPVWAIVYAVSRNNGSKSILNKILIFLLPCIIAAIISAPYIKTVASGGSVITADKSLGEYRFFYVDVQAVRNLIVFLFPFPLIGFGTWLIYKKYKLSGESMFVFAGIAVSLILSIFLRLNWWNSVKFSYVLSFFFSIGFVFFLKWFFEIIHRSFIRRLIYSLVLFYLIATPLLTEAAYIYSPWFTDNTYAFEGKHIVFNKDQERNEAYKWIRDNTLNDSLILMPFFETPYAPGGITIAQAFSYRPSAMTERSLFVMKDIYAFVAPGYQERVEIRHAIFSDPRSEKIKKYLIQLKRPVYLLVEDYQDDLMNGVEINEIPKNSVESFKPLFKNNRQTVYKFIYN